ncbi:right-handed parallel beta-helix repeat-containing protein [Pedobacter aquae]|nr:right-handed parallel beta-helix repeat-containing protein [Pedobacter aquae]
MKAILLAIIIFYGNTMLSACKKVNDVSQKDLPAKTYYVAVDGDDTNNGSIEYPFKSINYALSQALAGDSVILRGGTYVEKVKFPKSGVLNRYITLKAFKGETPVISGQGFGVFGSEGLITLSSVSWIILEGLEVTNFKTTTGSAIPDGILVNGASSNIVIRKNRVHHIEHNGDPATGRQAHAIHVIGNSTSPIMKVIVEENEIHDNNTGTSENLTVNGYVMDFVVRKNKIYNGENIGICVAGGYLGNPNKAFNYARNGVVADNEIWNIDGSTGPVPALANHGAIGIYIDGARRIIIERNKVYDSDRGIGIVSENDEFPTESCIVRNNFVYNSWLVGIYLGGYENYTGGGTKNCFVVNNTLYNNNRILGPEGVVEGEIRLTIGCFNNVIKNNILYARADKGVFINKQNAGGENNIIGNNLYYTTGTITNWKWDAISYNNFNDWIAASGDSNSLFGVDPLFVNAAAYNLSLQASSRAIGVGQINNQEGTTDFFGNPRTKNGLISIGAHEVHQ